MGFANTQIKVKWLKNEWHTLDLTQKYEVCTLTLIPDTDKHTDTSNFKRD